MKNKNVANVLVQNMDMNIIIFDIVITVEAVKLTFKELFKEQQQTLLNIVASNMT